MADGIGGWRESGGRRVDCHLVIVIRHWLPEQGPGRPVPHPRRKEEHSAPPQAQLNPHYRFRDSIPPHRSRGGR